MSDRDEIIDVLARYGRALDDRDFVAAGECFTADAQATFSGVVLEPGREAIVRHVSGLASLSASTHLFGLPMIEVDGDTATSTTTAIAVLAAADGGTVRTRGLVYRDRWLRTADGWRIADREHSVHWMTETGSSPL